MRRVLISALASLSIALPVVTAGPAAAGPDATWQRTFGGEVNYHSSPTIADVDGDGRNDVVVATQNGWVRAFRADGSDLPGWPRRISIGGTHPGVDGSPTVADLDRDGRNEVIVGAGRLRNDREHGGVVVFNRDGGTRWIYRTGDKRESLNGNGYTDAVFSTPAVGDVTGDGLPEVVFGSFDHHVHVVDRQGRNIPGSPFFSDDTIFSSPALADVDGDRRDEIFIGVDSSAGGSQPNSGGVLRMLETSAGVLSERWQRQTAEIIVSSPALGDIDGDGRFEVVFGTGDYYKNGDSRRVFALDAENGADVPGWPQTTGGDGWSSPAVGDLNGDGRADVVIGARDGRLYAWHGNGRALWNVNPADGTPFTSGIITSGPVIADVNGDGRNEALVATGNAVFARAGHNGGLVDTFATHWQYQASPAVGEFGGRWRVVASGYLDANGTMMVGAWDIPKPKTTPPWPMFRQNPAHRGSPTATTSRSTADGGYWVLDVKGDVYTFGNAPFYGSIGALKASGQPIGDVRAEGLVGTPDRGGYWVLDEVGGIFTFGNARFYGSVPGLRAQGVPIGDARVIGLAPNATGKGYWLLDEFGGMFSFGDARFHGSVPGLRANGVRIGAADVVTVVSTPTGNGYWILDGVGGMFAFGDARFLGSVPGLRASGIPVGPATIVGMAPTASGKGYWLVDDTGGMFAFGDARYYGSIPELRQKGHAIGPASIVSMVPTPTGKGYWLLDDKGGLFAFGDAKYYGSLPELGIGTTAVAMSPSR